jgi:hypothetical protein
MILDRRLPAAAAPIQDHENCQELHIGLPGGVTGTVEFDQDY